MCCPLLNILGIILSIIMFLFMWICTIHLHFLTKFVYIFSKCEKVRKEFDQKFTFFGKQIFLFLIVLS